MEPSEVQEMLDTGLTYSQISAELKSRNPHITKGLSEHSVRRFVSQNGMRLISKQHKEQALADAIPEVGPTYGRRMLKGYLASRGVSISDRHLRSAVRELAPIQHSQRQLGQVDRVNPRLYHADYFGQKLHLDQNEKLAMYGITYVLARDGYSGKLTAGAIMPCKNNLTIYDKVYRSTVLAYGLWDQVRVDHGREFYLVLFMQEKLRYQRGNPSIVPYRQTTSRQNHVIERVWVELNQRVSYPLKRAVRLMENLEMIDTELDIVKFCLAVVLTKLCEIGMERFISAWNNHHLPLRGIPNLLQSHPNGTTAIHPSEIPTVEEAAAEYRQQGGHLTDPRPYGSDPLEGNDGLIQQREELFEERVGSSFSDILGALLAGNKAPFERAVLQYVSITEELSP